MISDCYVNELYHPTIIFLTRYFNFYTNVYIFLFLLTVILIFWGVLFQYHFFSIWHYFNLYNSAILYAQQVHFNDQTKKKHRLGIIYYFVLKARRLVTRAHFALLQVAEKIVGIKCSGHVPTRNTNNCESTPSVTRISEVTRRYNIIIITKIHQTPNYIIL